MTNVLIKECSGKHAFIPFVWRQLGQNKNCTLMICQHCLAVIDVAEIERIGRVREANQKEGLPHLKIKKAATSKAKA